MFCRCDAKYFGENPNSHICPVCLGLPGALPVPNKLAIDKCIKLGLALNCEINKESKFDRKNYFYPDIPKGYQISQYKYPIVSGGALANMDITRIHLEEDTGNNKHLDIDKSSPTPGVGEEGYSLIDFNRAGVPLMELVTEAHTFDTAEEAAKVASNFAKEYQLLLWYLGVSEANMEKGEMRVEANVSISPDKDKKWNEYVEVKNLNSFRSVERAIKFEVERMVELFETGHESEIVKETRGFDESKQKTFSQRRKESSHDYRYFPDPDLPKMKLHSAFDLEKMEKELPELPVAKRARYKNDFGIKDEDIEAYINDMTLGVWFENIARILDNKEKIKIASNYITTDFIGLKKNNKEVNMPSAKNMAELASMIMEGMISSRGAKDILAMIVVKDQAPMKIALEKDLLQKNDVGVLKEIAQKIIDANEKVVADYKGGKEQALMSLVGQIMKETKGSANPEVARKTLIDLLK